MRVVDLQQAKCQLSDLLALAEAGEEIVIARNGEPVARLTKADVPSVGRVPGLDKGRIWYADDLNAPLQAHLMSAFEG